MSDELSTGFSAELSTALHEFAAEHETPPVLTGAEVRGSAVRRARRRMAGTLAAGAVALALLAFALTLDLAEEGNQRQVPAASPAVPSTPATSGGASPLAPVVPITGTVDLRRRILTVGDRVMPLTKEFLNSPKIVGPMTVYKKHDTKVLTVTNPTDGAGYNAEVSLAVELRDANNEPVYVGVALSYKGKGFAKHDTSSGWIGLDVADAKWFYAYAKIGSVLSVTGTVS